MVLAVVFLWIDEFAGLGFGVLAVIWGSFHSADLGFEGYVLVLPFYHGLLGGQCCVVEGII